jgi:hypothetical protein
MVKARDPRLVAMKQIDHVALTWDHITMEYKSNTEVAQSKSAKNVLAIGRNCFSEI